MNVNDFYTITGLHIMLNNPVFQANYKTRDAAVSCLQLMTRLMIDRETGNFADDFGVAFCVNFRVVGHLVHGWHSDFHKRAIDVGDTQQYIADNYESEFGSKVGVGR